ncbi:MAG: hypothetical protein ACXV5Q_03565 [Frankiaceae bacterium]
MPEFYPLSAALLTSWSNAWLAGAAGLDDLADALSDCCDAGAGCVRVAEPAPAQPLLLHLGGLRRAGVAWFRLALPAPGDVADLAGPREARHAALAAGAAVVGGRSASRPTHGGVVLVPPGAGTGGGCWRSWPAEVTAWTLVSPAEAEQELLGCLRAATDELRRLDLARDARGVLARFAAGRESGGTGARPQPLRLPPGLPARSVTLLDRCNRLSEILAAASQDEGASVSRSEMQRRSSALAGLAAATRRASSQAWSAGALALAAAS